MNLKKRMIVIVFILLFAVGCAQTNSTVANASATPVIDRIQKSGTLRVGMTGNMPPLNMTSKEGELMGYEVDLARAMAKSMGVKAQLKTMPFAELLPALEAGKIDMIISNMTITPGRNMKVAFVGPYFVSGKAFLTKKRPSPWQTKPMILTLKTPNWLRSRVPPVRHLSKPLYREPSS